MKQVFNRVLDSKVNYLYDTRRKIVSCNNSQIRRTLRFPVSVNHTSVKNLI